MSSRYLKAKETLQKIEAEIKKEKAAIMEGMLQAEMPKARAET